ncbi:MAG: FmdE family protein [Spirochaetia bacterium]|jgi:formylmethanofuran dehydrogenase subunit E|nr:FmdE family protein [Spirochaetia bacterium]
MTQHELWEKAVAFHGHECPGLAIGVRASMIAMKRLKINDRAKDEELVCITENDACGVDAVQALLGCTLGKGNLIFRDTGKQAFSFYERKTGSSFRIVLNQLPKELNRNEKINYILTADEEKVFSSTPVKCQIPERARLFTSVQCETCHEYASEGRIRLQNGKKVCMDCFVPYERWEKR